MNTIDSIIVLAKQTAKKNWLQAMNILEHQIDETPTEPRLYKTLGEILMAKGQYRPALTQFLRALGYDPDSADILHSIGLCYMMTGEHRLALAYLKRIVDPTQDVLYNIGYAQSFLGQHEESLRTLQKLLEDLPDHPYVIYMTFEQYYSLGMYDEAISFVEEAIQNIGEDLQLYLFAGLAYSLKREWLRSFYYYDKAMKLGKINNVDSMLRAAEAAMHLGIHQRAIDLLLQCEKRWPYISEIYANLVKIYLHLDKSEEAKQVVKRADEKLESMSPTLRFLKSMVREKV